MWNENFCLKTYNRKKAELSSYRNEAREFGPRLSKKYWCCCYSKQERTIYNKKVSSYLIKKINISTLLFATQKKHRILNWVAFAVVFEAKKKCEFFFVILSNSLSYLNLLLSLKCKYTRLLLGKEVLLLCETNKARKQQLHLISRGNVSLMKAIVVICLHKVR